MPQLTVGEKIKFIERLRTRKPVNRQAALVVAKAWGWWNEQKELDPVKFLSRRPQITEMPHCINPPTKCHLIGMEKGCVKVIGYVSPDEKSRLGWTGRGNWVVQCQCGRYEHRRTDQLLRKPEKEYGDACTWCRGIWAEYVKAEFKKSKKWPNGGGPTFRASYVDR